MNLSTGQQSMHDQTWIVVADGARARIFRHKAGDPRLEPAIDRDIVASHSPLRDLETDRPGRQTHGVGRGRSAMEVHEDSRRHAERALAGDVAAELEAARQQGLRRVILVAAPRTLGDLREAIDDPLRAIVVHEIDKDLTQVPAHELMDRLVDRLV